MSEPSREATADLRANRLDLLSRWADDLAHEIKNPFHAMVINLELVKRRAASGDAGPLVQRAEIVESEIHRVHDLVEALLRLMRPWSDPGPAQVDQVFAAMAPVIAARARIRQVEIEHRPAGAAVPMGPGPLALVVLNLLDNAMEATSAGGRVVTTTVAEGDQVRIAVLDDGAGLPEGAADRLFEAGVGEWPGRAGLGLAIAARLVHDAGGTLALEPAPGHGGALATVVLPRAGSA
jgi:two-component system, NtrC family, sensor histidine kinase HydH